MTLMAGALQGYPHCSCCHSSLFTVVCVFQTPPLAGIHLVCLRQLSAGGLGDLKDRWGCFQALHSLWFGQSTVDAQGLHDHAGDVPGVGQQQDGTGVLD